MAWSVDARVPVLLLTSEAELAKALGGPVPSAVLVEAPPAPMPVGAIAQASFDRFMSHAPGCGCCEGRGAVAGALGRLFQARQQGACGWFTQVIALAETPGAEAEIRAALRDDPGVAECFRASFPRGD